VGRLLGAWRWRGAVNREGTVCHALADGAWGVARPARRSRGEGGSLAGGAAAKKMWSAEGVFVALACSIDARAPGPLTSLRGVRPMIRLGPRAREGERATRGRSAPGASSAETASARRPSLERPRSSLARRRAGGRRVEPDRAGTRSLHRFTEKAHGSRNAMRVRPMTSTGTPRGHGSDCPTRPEGTRRTHAAPWPSLGALGRPCLRATCSSNRAPADRPPRSENGA